jgi:hypothetical protein
MLKGSLSTQSYCWRIPLKYLKKRVSDNVSKHLVTISRNLWLWQSPEICDCDHLQTSASVTISRTHKNSLKKTVKVTVSGMTLPDLCSTSLIMLDVCSASLILWVFCRPSLIMSDLCSASLVMSDFYPASLVMSDFCSYSVIM